MPPCHALLAPLARQLGGTCGGAIFITPLPPDLLFAYVPACSANSVTVRVLPCLYLLLDSLSVLSLNRARYSLTRFLRCLCLLSSSATFFISVWVLTSFFSAYLHIRSLLTFTGRRAFGCFFFFFFFFFLSYLPSQHTLRHAHYRACMRRNARDFGAVAAGGLVTSPCVTLGRGCGVHYYDAVC